MKITIWCLIFASPLHVTLHSYWYDFSEAVLSNWLAPELTSDAQNCQDAASRPQGALQALFKVLPSCECFGISCEKLNYTI